MQSVILCWETSGRIWGKDDHACLLSALSPELEILVVLVLRSMEGALPRENRAQGRCRMCKTRWWHHMSLVLPRECILEDQYLR